VSVLELGSVWQLEWVLASLLASALQLEWVLGSLSGLGLA
jgi:hypothetical protein